MFWGGAIPISISGYLPLCILRKHRFVKNHNSRCIFVSGEVQNFHLNKFQLKIKKMARNEQKPRWNK